jgi:hypothetical protein
MQASPNRPAPDAITVHFKPRPVPGVAQATVGNETLLAWEPFQPCRLLNPTAGMVWRRFDGETAVATIAENLAETFGADPTTVTTEVLALTRQLGSLGVLDNLAPAEQSERTEVPFENGGIDEFELPDLTGRLRSWASFRGHRVLLVNWSPYCPYCLFIGEQLGELKIRLLQQGIELVLITSGPAEPNGAVLEAAGLSDVVVLCRRDETDPFAGLGTPAALLFSENGSVSSPLAYGSSAVVDLALRLTGGPGATSRLQARSQTAGAGVCAPSGRSDSDGRVVSKWSGMAAYGFGQFRAGVRFNSAETETTLDRLFAGARVDAPGTPESYSVAIYPARIDGGTRHLNLLIRSGLQVVRSRSAGRVLRALVGHLSTELYEPSPRFLHADGLAVVHDGDAFILPSILYRTWPRVQPALNRLGLQIADLARLFVDPVTAELVVEEPHIPYDISVIAEKDRHSSTHLELPPVNPGRYPLKRWVVAAKHPQGLLSTATSAALTMELITRVPNLQTVLDALINLFGSAQGYALDMDLTRDFLDRLPVALGSNL